MSIHREHLSLLTASALAVAFAFGGTAVQAAPASSNVQALVAAAEHNTNTVNTLVHHDRTDIKTPTLTTHATVSGIEDEVHNREQDSESVTVTGKTKSGTTKTLHYTLDVIFMNGLTYYRTTLGGKNAWKTHKGSGLFDPYTGGFARARTKVAFTKKVVFKEVGTSGGETHVRATASNAKGVGTVDLWIQNGASPYVVREDVNSHSLKAPLTTQVSSTRFGPFNSRVIIQAPAGAGSA